MKRVTVSGQRDYSIQSVERSFKILETIAEAEEEIGAQEISTSLGLHISTVFRFLQTLAKLGVIDQNAVTGKYRLGLTLLTWGTQVLRQIDLRREAYPFLRELCERTGETVHMTIYDRDAAIYITKIEGTTPLRGFSDIGKGGPLHATGVGKVLMAGLSDTELTQLLRRSPPCQFTPNTITKPAELKKELKQIRAQGYALDNEEHEPGIRCVASPIHNHTGAVVASISVAGRTTSVTLQRVPELIEQVKETGRRISARLGFGSTSW